MPTILDIVEKFDILATGESTGLQAKQPREIKAGGPGSGCQGENCGRHPNAGSFSRTDNRKEGNQQVTSYMSRKGDQVVINRREGTDEHEVREKRGTGWVTTHTGDRSSTVAHMAERYGLSHSAMPVDVGNKPGKSISIRDEDGKDATVKMGSRVRIVDNAGHEHSGHITGFDSKDGRPIVDYKGDDGQDRWAHNDQIRKVYGSAISAGGPGSGCHGPNCGRHGGKTDSKGHVPKSSTVSKNSEGIAKVSQLIKSASKVRDDYKAYQKVQDQAWKIVKGIKYNFKPSEIAEVKKLADKFKATHDKDWRDENPDYKDSYKDQVKGYDLVLKSMQMGALVGVVYHGMYAVDDENYPSETRALGRVLNQATARDKESVKAISKYYYEFD